MHPPPQPPSKIWAIRGRYLVEVYDPDEGQWIPNVSSLTQILKYLRSRFSPYDTIIIESLESYGQHAGLNNGTDQPKAVFKALPTET